MGEAGQGKSSLINGLLGEEIAKESDDLEFAFTENVDRYEYEQNGVHVVLWDTPGFGVGEDEEELAETLRKIREACPSIDMFSSTVFAWTPRDGRREATSRQSDNILPLTVVRYGTIFVMTFANTVPQPLPT